VPQLPIRRLAIIGDGQMGLVMAHIAAAQPFEPRVSLWCHDPDSASSLSQTRKSSRLPMITLDESITVTGSANTALERADMILAAVPTQFIRPVWEELAPVIREHAPHAGIVSVAKGIENSTLLRPTQIITRAMNEPTPRSTGVLSGPTIASELARGLPATMIAASDNPVLAQSTQQLFTTTYLRIYTSEDPIGVEVAGACKNVIAIAAGILDGLKAGFNAKSALLARGLAETTRLGLAMGAQAETFYGLAGAGDLATTCFSPEGRNRSCGEALGKGESLDSYLKRTDSVVEGVATAESLMQLKEHHRVEMPICETVYRVLNEGMDPIDGIQSLMSREPKAERIG